MVGVLGVSILTAHAPSVIPLRIVPGVHDYQARTADHGRHIFLLSLVMWLVTYLTTLPSWKIL